MSFIPIVAIWSIIQAMEDNKLWTMGTKLVKVKGDLILSSIH